MNHLDAIGAHLLLLGILLALTGLPSSGALAQAPARFSLEWVAPAGCPDREAVLAEAELLLTSTVEGHPRLPLVAQGSVERENGLWQLELAIGADPGSGRRVLRDESCLRLAQAAALSLALALEVAAMAPAAPVETAAAPPPAPAPADSPRTPPRFLVRALVGGDFGTLRAPSPGPGLALGVFLGRTRIEAVGNYWLAQDEGGAEDQLISGGVHVCTALAEAPELGACVGLDGGRLQGRGFDSRTDAQARTIHAAWMAAIAGAAIGWELVSWFALRAELDIGVTLVSPAFGASEGAATYGGLVGPAPVFGRVAGGLEARF
ncbi:MAG: hypothetical protein HY901_18555 [Deltaproteobacteria bacterium]|nr:hypothetical protein [Deltaproteobacteria bacterium]